MSKKNPVDRRGFLRGAAVAAGAARLVGKPPIAMAQQVALKPETSSATAEVSSNQRPGADFMVDVIKSLGIEYCAANPGSSFRGLQESIINYGGNTSPEWLTCCHEESSVAMAHGYAKIEGKPMMIMAHGTVGLQHASMAIYNAYCDRVPIFIVAGNILDVTYRRGNAEWVHSVQDAAAMVRDYTKWDDNPVSLAHFAESAVRAYKIAMTPPYEPVVIVADGALQEEPISEKNLRDPQAGDEHAAPRRDGRGEGSRQDAGGRRESGDRCRTRGAHTQGRRAAGRAGGDAAGAGAGPATADEFPHSASARRTLSRLAECRRDPES